MTDPAPDDRRELWAKAASLVITFGVMALLTCLLLAWLVWQMPGLERINQGVIYAL